jgi:hypothetical protein
MAISLGGAGKISIGSISAVYQFQLVNDALLSWSSAGVNGLSDVILARAAAGTLALRDGTNNQTLRVYGTTTGPKYGSLSCTSTAYRLDVADNTMEIRLGETAGAIYAYIDVYPGTDNARDLGASGLRWRTGYFGTSISIGSSTADSGVVRLQNDTTIRWRNAANSANIDALAVLSTNNVVLGNGAYAIRIGNNSGASLGFFGATPVTRPTYGAPTGGGPTRTTFDTTTVTLAQLAERVRAIIDDFRLYGLFA